MKKCFREKKFREDLLERIDLCNGIIRNYQAQGLRLTLRQLYYQLVTRNAIKNEEKSYKNLSTLISDARLAGLVDWDAIEDRVRVPRTPNEWDDLSGLVESALAAYRLDRWEGQAHYVELWVEKDALAGVLSPIANEHHVTMMVNRGYSSQSAMYESSLRFARNGRGKSKILFYLGDHDPSGEDMVRDIADRFAMFGVQMQVIKLALTMAQVEQYNPPPNPAKITDPRAKNYILEFGHESWEVDALPPETLRDIIVKAFDGVLDREEMNEVILREEADKSRLRRMVDAD